MKMTEQAQLLMGNAGWGTLNHCQPWDWGSGLGFEDSQGSQQETCPLRPTYPASQETTSLEGQALRTATVGPQRPLEEVWCPEPHPYSHSALSW